LRIYSFSDNVEPMFFAYMIDIDDLK